MLNSRLLKCVYSLTWNVFSLLDVNATYVYTFVKQIYITLSYVVDVDADQSVKIYLSYIVQYANMPDLYKIKFQSHFL